MPSEKARLAKAYWRANIKVLTVLLTIWATPSLLLGIILVEPLNRIMIGGFPLGFWFAQQGSTITFVLLILAYALIMDKLDKKYIGENENE
ncbi:MAG: DUF4212 domain-containing protein [Sumerlaeia bacterium]